MIPIGNPPAVVKDLVVSERGYAFDPQSGESFSLNGTAVAVLQGFQSGRSPDDLVNDLATRYDAAPEVIRSGIAAFVRQLDRQFP